MNYQQARDEAAAEQVARGYGGFGSYVDREMSKHDFKKGADWSRKYTLMSDEVRQMRKDLICLMGIVESHSAKMMITTTVQAFDKLMKEME